MRQSRGYMTLELIKDKHSNKPHEKLKNENTIKGITKQNKMEKSKLSQIEKSLKKLSLESKEVDNSSVTQIAEDLGKLKIEPKEMSFEDLDLD